MKASKIVFSFLTLYSVSHISLTVSLKKYFSNFFWVELQRILFKIAAID